jgi:hypothetical protein
MQSNKTLPEFSWEVFSWQMLILSSIFLWIHCLKHLFKHQFKGNDKLIWLLIIIFLPVIGGVFYLFKNRQS